MDPPCNIPAVDHNWSGIWRVEELDLTHKAQEACGVAGHAMVRPAGEVELPDLSNLMVALL